MNFGSPIKTTSSKQFGAASLTCFGDMRGSPHSFMSPVASLDQKRNKYHHTPSHITTASAATSPAETALSSTTTPLTNFAATPASNQFNHTFQPAASHQLSNSTRSPPSSQLKTPTKYQDRFIPARTDSISKTLFDLKDESSAFTAATEDEEEASQQLQQQYHQSIPLLPSPLIHISPSTQSASLPHSHSHVVHHAHPHSHHAHPAFLFDPIGGLSSPLTASAISSLTQTGNTAFLISPSTALFPRSIVSATTGSTSYLSFSTASPQKKKKPAISQKDENTKNYSEFMQKELFGTTTGGSNSTNEPSILKFNSHCLSKAASSLSSPFPHNHHHKHHSHLLAASTSPRSSKSPFSLYPPDERNPKDDKRKIAKTPFKVLDAPGLQDDFYIDLLDWSSRNQIAVGLGKAIFIWNAGTGSVEKLCEHLPHSASAESNSPDQSNPHLNAASFYTSLKWSPSGTHMVIGNQTGKVDYWDVASQTIVRSFHKQTERIGSLDFNNNNVFASGSKDKSILIQDIRDPTTLKIATGHNQEVCQVRWSPDQQYLASGGNDNAVLIWNLNRITPTTLSSSPSSSPASSSLATSSFPSSSSRIQAYQANVEHRAAVRALAWNPHQYGVLLSGGGSRDQTIKVWNVNRNSIVNSIDVGSQVCKLAFSPDQNEFVAAHGFEYNRITVWKYPTLSQIAELEGHQNRVLFMSLSPDAQSIVTGAGDETLKLWKIFQGKPPVQPSQLEQLSVIR